MVLVLVMIYMLCKTDRLPNSKRPPDAECPALSDHSILPLSVYWANFAKLVRRLGKARSAPK